MRPDGRILVTGATGFLGSALCRRLEAAGYSVSPVSRSHGHHLGTTGALQEFMDAPCETVVHLAGRTFVPESWTTPEEFYRDNALGTQQVLELCRTSGARLLYVSAYVYGIPRYLPIDEAHPVSPNNPYAHSKWLGEELCRFYTAHFGVPTTVLRPFNLYGPGQRPPFLIPSLIQQLRDAGRIQVQDLTPRRDFLHVEDFVTACMLVLEHGARGVFNVGAGRSHSVREVLDLLRIHVPGATWQSRETTRPGEIPDVVADCRALCDAVGWTPTLTLEEGLAAFLRAEGMIVA